MTTLPPGTRLILASEDLLAKWGARTEDGYRITVEWGEERPDGWYEPTFRIHHDDQLCPPDAYRDHFRWSGWFTTDGRPLTVAEKAEMERHDSALFDAEEPARD